MSIKEWFDLAGYAAGVGLLGLVAGAALLKRLGPAPREQAYFVLFAVALFLWSTLPGAHANRWLAFMGLWLAWSVTRIQWSDAWRRRLSNVAIIAINGFALCVALDAVFRIGRPLTINPNTASAILLVGLPLALGDTAGLGRRRLLGRCALIAAALVLTGSRAALLGLLVSALVLSWPRLAAPRRLPAVIAAIGVAAVMIGLRPETAWVRLEHWGEALRLWAASPVIGWGASTYQFVSRLPGQLHADSAPLTLLAEQGLIGMLLLFPLALAVARRWPSAPALARVCLLAFGLQQLADDTWLSPWPAILLGINLGILWRISAAEAPEIEVQRESLCSET